MRGSDVRGPHVRAHTTSSQSALTSSFSRYFPRFFACLFPPLTSALLFISSRNFSHVRLVACQESSSSIFFWGCVTVVPFPFLVLCALFIMYWALRHPTTTAPH